MMKLDSLEGSIEAVWFTLTGRQSNEPVRISVTSQASNRFTVRAGTEQGHLVGWFTRTVSLKDFREAVYYVVDTEGLR